jgi:hypothetical protein
MFSLAQRFVLLSNCSLRIDFEILSAQSKCAVLSLGKTLAAAGHVPHQKFSARGGVGKVSNYINMLPVGYWIIKNINFANYYVQNTCYFLFIFFTLNLQEHSYILTYSQIKKPSKSLLAVLSRVVIQCMLSSHSSAVITNVYYYF